MGEGKHTPGPWRVEPVIGTWIESIGCCHRGHMHVADVRGWGHLTGHGQGAHAMSAEDARAIQEANARLIAAAPDLLEALHGILARYTRLIESGDAGHWDCETEDEVIAARSALAKAHPTATGEK